MSSSLGIVTITHTRSDGTLLRGSRDGVLNLVSPYGFAYLPSLDCLGIPRSHDRPAQTYRIDAARAALEAAGWTVEVRITEDAHEAPAGEGGEEQTHQRAGQGSDDVSMDPQTLRGHHPEGPEQPTGRTAYARRRNDPERALRRIDALEADRRRVLRSLERSARGSDLHAEYIRQLAEIDAQLAHWRCVVARAEAEGFKVWSRDDFQRGDFVQYRGVWYEVLRVNARSVTIPQIHPGTGRNVVRKDDGPSGCYTWTARYHDGITGRMSAEEMAKAEARAAEENNQGADA